MNRDQLVSVQQPLKDRYRSEPEAARVTLRAEGTRRRPEHPGRLHRYPAPFRPGEHRERRATCHTARTHRALLRGLPDAGRHTQPLRWPTLTPDFPSYQDVA